MIRAKTSLSDQKVKGAFAWDSGSGRLDRCEGVIARTAPSRWKWVVVPVLLASLGVSTIGCATTYSAYPAQPVDIGTVLSTQATRDPGLIASWDRMMGRCSLTRRNMLREAETIQRNDRAIGAIFVGLAAGFAAAMTIYNAATDHPDRVVTTVLGAGAGLSTAPAFAYLGADTRMVEVRARIAEIDRLHGEAIQLADDLSQHRRPLTEAATALAQATAAADTARTARNTARTESQTADQEVVDADTALRATQAAANATAGSTARTAARGRLPQAQENLAARNRTARARAETLVQREADLRVAEARVTDRQTADDSAEARHQEIERNLQSHLQRMWAACQ